MLFRLTAATPSSEPGFLRIVEQNLPTINVVERLLITSLRI